MSFPSNGIIGVNKQADKCSSCKSVNKIKIQFDQEYMLKNIATLEPDSISLNLINKIFPDHSFSHDFCLADKCK